MQIWFILESIILYYCLSILVVKIYENRFKITSVLLSFIYVPIVFISIHISYHTFMLMYPILAVINIFLIKITYSKVKLSSLLYLYAFLFVSVAVLSSTLLILFPKNRYLIEFIAYVFMLVLCCFVAFTKTLNKIKLIYLWTPKFLKITILILLVLTSWVGTLIFDIYDYSSNKVWLLLIQMITVLMIVFVCILLPIVIENSVKNRYLLKLTDNYKKQIENQANHYSALAKSNWEIRRFRHDFKNLWIGLNELIAKGETQEALNMLNKCHGSFVNSTDSILTFDTGNGIVDALLSDKQEVAKTHNAVLQFSGAVPSQGIAPTDLCVLFGNTLDNALEACEKLPAKSPKTINIVCKRTGNFLFIYIKNPVVENVEIKNNAIPTTKEDKSAHGFGLYSLEQVVRKHDGELKLTCNDHLFETAIDLCLDI